MKEYYIKKENFITLQDLLKIENVACSGGEAKQLIIDGHVTLNGEIETRRGKKLYDGDIVKVGDEQIKVLLP